MRVQETHFGILQVLTSLFALNHPLREAVRDQYRSFATAMVAFQRDDGLWHQVVNETTTFAETSVTAMTVASLAIGVREGWLDNATFLPHVKRGWEGLNSRIAANGTIEGVCMGTGIMPNVSAYNARGTDFFQSAPGGAGVRACNMKLTHICEANALALWRDHWHAPFIFCVCNCDRPGCALGCG